jgi:iron(III) transport system substrate-binding protein
MNLNSFSRLSLALASALVLPASAGSEVNVYSYRKPELIQPMFDQFTAQSGVNVNVVYAKKGMLEKLKHEGVNSPADLVFTVDIGRLSDIKDAGLTQPVDSAVLDTNIPANLRDHENHWFGLTSRARIIVVSRDRIADGAVASYEDLANPELKGLVCTRSGKHAYMVALTASMISHHGVEQAQEWLHGLRDNLARKPEGNDRAQVKAIREGVCDVAVINHYYMYQMISDPEQKPWADAVNVVFPNQQGRGTHMNVSGMAMTRHAPNRDNALALMEFLSSAQAQAMYAQMNGEYAVKPGIPLAEAVAAWGTFKQDTIGLTDIAANRAEASKMADRVAYDQ